jgi:hypothetical protein
LQAGGIDYAVGKTTLSLAGLRRYRFPIGGQQSIERDLAGRTVVTALFVLAYELAAVRGYYLRSGCSLVPDRPATRDIIGADGVRVSLPWDEDTRPRVDVARELYVAAVAAAAKQMVFDDARTLNANDDLNAIVGMSTRLEAEAADTDAA